MIWELFYMQTSVTIYEQFNSYVQDFYNCPFHIHVKNSLFCLCTSFVWIFCAHMGKWGTVLIFWHYTELWKWHRMRFCTSYTQTHGTGSNMGWTGSSFISKENKTRLDRNRYYRYWGKERTAKLTHTFIKNKMGKERKGGVTWQIILS